MGPVAPLDMPSALASAVRSVSDAGPAARGRRPVGCALQLAVVVIEAALLDKAVLPAVVAYSALAVPTLFVLARIAAMFGTAGVIFAIVMSVVEALWILVAAILARPDPPREALCAMQGDHPMQQRRSRALVTGGRVRPRSPRPLSRCGGRRLPSTARAAAA